MDGVSIESWSIKLSKPYSGRSQEDYNNQNTFDSVLIPYSNNKLMDEKASFFLICI